MINIFGYTLTLAEFLSVCTVLTVVIGGYYKFLGKVNFIEKEGMERFQSLEKLHGQFNDRVTPLEAQVSIQAQNHASLAATLAGVQPQLSSVSNRLDTIIALMLKDKEK